jgi:hypothetical protein
MEWPITPKDVKTRRISASTLVCESPCLLIGLVLAPVTTSGQITAWDGQGTLGEAKATFDITKGTTLVYGPSLPPLHRDGLYIEFTTFAGYVTVQYAKLQQGE